MLKVVIEARAAQSGQRKLPRELFLLPMLHLTGNNIIEDAEMTIQMDLQTALSSRT